MAEDVPLTPMVVDCVTFDRAPLGRRGYHEDQVDDFLDRVQATLAGTDSLTAQDVRGAEFDPAPLMRRGYHEDQVDEFLDLVVEELSRREARAVPPKRAPLSQPTPSPAPAIAHAPAHVRPAPPARPANPMAFAPPLTRPDGAPVMSRPPMPIPTRPAPDLLTLPIPPAPPGEPGYEPADVERLARLLAGDPTADQLAALELTRTTRGYHTATVDALRSAWVVWLRSRVNS